MIQSMTGYGAAEHVEDGVSYSLEIRSVNNRYLKLSIKLPELVQFAESAVEKLVRDRISRGTITCTVRMRSADTTGVGTINVSAMQHYLDMMAGASPPTGVRVTVDLGMIAALPGVCQPPEVDDEARTHQLGILENLVSRGLDAMIGMRRNEGDALRTDILGCCEAIRAKLSGVAERAPEVIDEYHERLRSRVEALMQAGGFELEADGLMREVAVFAERCDISEELTRIGAHLDQTAELCDSGEPVGRTLDFLTQELLREANTIASKSNDVTIARSVVEIKGLIDRLKEQVQNVE